MMNNMMGLDKQWEEVNSLAGTFQAIVSGCKVGGIISYLI